MRLDELFLTEQTYIAYHGTGARIEQFGQPYVAPHFFTQDIEYAKHYSGGKTPISVIDKPKRRRNYLLTVELDIQHLFDTKADPQALAFYNEKFVPQINALHAKYHQPLVPELAAGRYPSFVYADQLWRYFMRFESPYDGMLVDEAIVPTPAIVPFQASQVKILKRQIIKFD